jgi:peptide/nickel transport system substrate-binding protein
VTYRFVSDSSTRLAGLMAGEFDLITNLLPEFTKKVPQAIQRKPERQARRSK